ncbi:MAG: thioredoxin [Zetaproteobacteria bacterium]|nr:thioredoxin [Zetaproteobacteria bacterium]
MSERTIEVADDNFDAEVLKSETPVLVDFWAPWCGPCVAVAPTIDSLASEYAGKVKVCKMNVDENKDTPTTYGVRSIPFLAVFKGGEMVQAVAGAQPKAKLAQLLDGVIG